MQKAVGTEVVGEIDLGEQVAIEIGGADCERPTLSTLRVECAVDFLKLQRRLPQKEMFSPTVLCARHRVLHRVGDVGPCVKNACAIGEEVADD